MPRSTAKTDLIRITACAAMLIAGSSASKATDFNFLWPSDASELGAPSWSGLIINPDAGYERLNLSGPASRLLKDPRGARVGGEVGYDLQIGGIVIGAAADGNYSWIDGGGRDAGSGVFETDLKYFGTLRGRLGYAFGRLMAYGTAGWAFGELEIKDTVTHVSDSNALSGWVAGGGLEYVWNKSFTLRGEYTHVGFGSDTFSSLPAGSQTVSSDMDLFKFGAITRF